MNLYRRPVRTVCFASSVGLILLFGLVLQIHLGSSYIRNNDEGVYLLGGRLVAEGQPLFTKVFSSQAPLFLEIVAWAFRFFGDTTLVGRELMVLFSSLSLACVGWLAWRIAGPPASPLTIFTLGISSCFFGLSRTCMAEMPSLAFTLLALCLGWASCRREVSWDWLAAGACFALSVLCKMLTSVMLVPLLFIMLFSATGDEPEEWHLLPLTPASARTLLWRLLLLGLGGLLATAVVVLRYDLQALNNQVINFHMGSRDAYYSDLTVFAKKLLQFFSINLGLVILALAGGVALWRQRRAVAIWLLIWMVSCLLFLANHRPLSTQHLVLILPPLALAAAACIYWLAPLRETRWWTPAIVGMGLFSLCGDAIPADYEVITARYPASDQAALELIKQYTQPGDQVISDRQMLIFDARRAVPPDLSDTSQNRIVSHYLSDETAIRESGDAKMILVWNKRFTLLKQYRQWIQTNFRLLKTFNGPNDSPREVYLRPDKASNPTAPAPAITTTPQVASPH